MEKNRLPDPVNIQFSISTQRRKDGRDWTQKELQSTILQWAITGQQQPHAIVRVVEWRNSGRSTKEGRKWKSSNDPGESLEKARTSLHLARLLQSARNITFKIRKD